MDFSVLLWVILKDSSLREQEKSETRSGLMSTKHCLTKLIVQKKRQQSLRLLRRNKF